MPIPYVIPPINWLRAVLLFRIRPPSNAPTKRLTLISPRSWINPHLGELRAECVHREFLLLVARCGPRTSASMNG